MLKLLTASMMTNPASLYTKYLLLLSLHLVVYMSKIQVGKNLMQEGSGPQNTIGIDLIVQNQLAAPAVKLRGGESMS